jgi:hypothetical protein
MRELGIKTDAATMERVSREVNSTRRERELREEAARAGRGVDTFGKRDVRSDGERLAREVRQRLGQGRPV